MSPLVFLYYLSVVLDLVLLQSLGNMLLFQYLVTVLEGDFQPRNCVYAGKLILFYFYFLYFFFLLLCGRIKLLLFDSETANWVLLRESLLNMLLVFISLSTPEY